MSRSTTLARLTVETAVAHRSIDERLFGPLDFPTAAGYRRFLCLLYGFQAPLERAVMTTPGIDLAFVEERCKAARIASDLMALGLTHREFQLLVRRQTIGPFATPAEALGWLYTTERLTLQIEALRIQLLGEMPVVFGLASQFISSNQHVADIRWRLFGAYLDRVARDHGVDAIVAGARAGLASLESWLAEHAPTTELAAETAGVEQRASA